MPAIRSVSSLFQATVVKASLSARLLADRRRAGSAHELTRGRMLTPSGRGTASQEPRQLNRRPQTLLAAVMSLLLARQSNCFTWIKLHQKYTTVGGYRYTERDEKVIFNTEK